MKYILFSGATGGLGFPCVKALSDRGYAVFACGTSQEKLAGMGKLPNVIPIRMDVTSSESVDAAREAVLRHTDSLYAVVNFAGLSAFCSMVEGDAVRVAQKVADVNLMGTVRVNRAFFELVRRGGGRIINCSSEAGWMTAQPFAAPYFMTKHAVEAYSDSLRRELMYLGVPVVKLQPGSFKTNMTDGLATQFDKALEETAYYKQMLTRMKPLMTNELNQGNDPARLAATVLKALEARRPKLRYRVGTGKKLALMELLPDKALDMAYRFMFKH